MLRRKMSTYLAVGTLVWVVDPFAQRVEVYAPGKAVQLLAGEMTLTAPELLPGFTLALTDIFPPVPADDADAATE